MIALHQVPKEVRCHSAAVGFVQLQCVTHRQGNPIVLPIIVLPVKIPSSRVSYLDMYVTNMQCSPFPRGMHPGACIMRVLPPCLVLLSEGNFMSPYHPSCHPSGRLQLLLTLDVPIYRPLVWCWRQNIGHGFHWMLSGNPYCEATAFQGCQRFISGAGLVI